MPDRESQATRSTPSLPFDLAIIILESVYNYSRFTEHYPTIAACALVCKSWTHVAQRILFRFFNRRWHPSHWREVFLSSVTKNPLLGTYVRSMSGLFISGNPNLHYSYHIVFSQFLSALACCPQLVELGVAIDLAFIPSDTLASLAALPLRLSHLAFNGRDYGVLYQLLHVWPSIRFLHIAGGLPRPPPNDRPPFCLESLSHELEVDDDILRWLLPPPQATPNRPFLTLDISHDSNRQHAHWYTDDVFVAYAPHIRSLTVGYELPEIESLTTLERLVLHREPPAPFTLPITVRHLGIDPLSRVDGALPLLHIMAALQAHPRLSVVSVNRDVSRNNLHSLKEICGREGINLVEDVTHDVPSYRVFPFARQLTSGNLSTTSSRFWKQPYSRSLSASVRRHELAQRQTPTTPQDTRPTPAPTGDPSPSTTVHITDEGDFALLLPNTAGELVSDAESDGVAFCSPGSGEAHCVNSMPEGFIVAASILKADDDAWIQVTGCLDANKFHLDPSDKGGQFDVRFPNGAQCTFGGYGASFIELVEPALNRFCLRCCAAENDQINCNSHLDRAGCDNAVPGVYTFPDQGVDCS
ncbi:hypothetical protein BV25DRAFT_1914881 [Artomyces pyxidatus]|uniref:Uncharacterized protein n=1 Tax=Artomyces pyxidatus TaxID=48021 RepID=A0ACB8T524_9AGAM|nr:hypothetical protein BV25DRAFT_1914881 [Artomyces pyxidatus]